MARVEAPPGVDVAGDAIPSDVPGVDVAATVQPDPTPHFVALRRDEAVRWCRCGRSRRQPWCDGSHAGTGLEPVRYRASQDEEVLFCGCKRTATPPFCDGTHNSLQAYATDDPDSEANRLISQVDRRSDGKARIDGGCFVCRVDEGPWQQNPGFTWTTVVSGDDGARHQSLFCLDLEPGASPAFSFEDRQVALLFIDVRGELAIGSRRFAIDARARAEVGACVLPGEGFRLTHDGGKPARVFVATGPVLDAPRWHDTLPPTFDARHPQRLAPVDPALRQAMAERYFQVLVSKTHGAGGLTQFIGEIPFSKALAHRHLYEETLIVLAGEGMMWTETLKAPVAAGDVIFLPRKQVHSLQCTSRQPLLVAGVIHPGDNPSISYY
jgi:CDGSH-type Zn-finger protein/mannose-6-phosphate isomerase-like protein (cupin superfamily)